MMPLVALLEPMDRVLFCMYSNTVLRCHGVYSPLPHPRHYIYFCGKQKGYIYKLINVVLVGSGIEGKSYNFHNLKWIIILD